MPVQPTRRESSRRLQRIAVLLALAGLPLLLIVAATVHPATPAAADPVNDEQQFMTLINELRTSKGLSTVQLDPELQHQSRLWAERLRSDGELSHAPDLSVGVSSNWAKLGENVGVAPEGQIQALFDAFVASPDHYANLIDPSFTFAGVGVVYDSEGRIWTTHRFMALASTPQQPPAATPQAGTPQTGTPQTSAPPSTPPQAPEERGSEPVAPPATVDPSETDAASTVPYPATVPLDQLAVAELFAELAS